MTLNPEVNEENVKLHLQGYDGAMTEGILRTIFDEYGLKQLIKRDTYTILEFYDVDGCKAALANLNNYKHEGHVGKFELQYSKLG